MIVTQSLSDISTIAGVRQTNESTLARKQNYQLTVKYLILPVGHWGLNLSFFVALRCWHVFLCYLLKCKNAVISSGFVEDELPAVLFGRGCHSCSIISVRQRQQCLVEKAWMSLRARQPRGSSRLPVCSCTRTQTHSYPHCTRSHSVHPSSHAHTYILTSSHAHFTRNTHTQVSRP